MRMSFEELHDPGFVTATATLSKDQSLDDVRKTMLDTIAAVVDGSADERRSRARQDQNPPGHGNANGQLAAGGARA